MKTIYLVLPCYNEEAVLHETSSRLKVKMNQLISENKISKDSRVTFVDDGSKDNTWSIIEELKESDELFEEIDDEDDESIFDSNDDDIIE